MNPTRLLIVNADDFGLAPGVNRAVAEAFDRGIVRSASLLAGGDFAEEAARIARQRPGLGVGVHLALTQVRPVLLPRQLPGLAGEKGVFPSGPAEFARRLLAGTIRRAEIIEEFAAQMKRALALGVRPTHLDSHQHVHLLPVVRSAFVEVALRFAVCRVRLPRLGGPRRSVRQWGRGVAVACAARSAARGLRGLRWPDRFWGLACSGGLDRERLLAILRGLPPGSHELMCHPVALDATVDEHVAWGYHGREELAALCHPAVQDELRGRAIRLGTFADLAPGTLA